MPVHLEPRRSPSIWPWILGLVVLALLIWGISALVNTDRDNGTLTDTTPPAPTPPADSSRAAAAGPASAPAPGPSAPEVAALTDLRPLGVQDVGQLVSASGRVLSAPAGGGFWLLTDDSAAIRVQGSEPVKAGQQVEALLGRLQQPSPAQLRSWTAAAGLPAGVGGHLMTRLYLDATASAPARSAAAASAPGGTPGD